MSVSKPRYEIWINGKANYTLKSGLGIRQVKPLTYSDCKELVNLMVVNDHENEIRTIAFWDEITQKVKHEWIIDNGIIEKVIG